MISSLKQGLKKALRGIKFFKDFADEFGFTCGINENREGAMWGYSKHNEAHYSSTLKVYCYDAEEVSVMPQASRVKEL